MGNQPGELTVRRVDLMRKVAYGRKQPCVLARHLPDALNRRLFPGNLGHQPLEHLLQLRCVIGNLGQQLQGEVTRW